MTVGKWTGCLKDRFWRALGPRINLNVNKKQGYLGIMKILAERK